MKKKAGILFLAKINGGMEVWLGKRISAPYEKYWGTVTGDIKPGERTWDCACREAREELNLDVVALKGKKSAMEMPPVKYAIPFLSHVVYYVLLLEDKGIIDNQARFVGNFEDSGWYPVKNPPQKSHLSIHFALGTIEEPDQV